MDTTTSDGDRVRRARHGDERPAAHSEALPLSRVAMSEEERAKLRAAMDELAEEHRAVLRLVHEDGLRIADVAAVMGRTTDAARMLYGRAVAALAARMSRRG